MSSPINNPAKVQLHLSCGTSSFNKTLDSSLSNNFSSLQLKIIKDVEPFYFLTNYVLLRREIEIPYFQTVLLPIDKLCWFERYGYGSFN